MGLLPFVPWQITVLQTRVPLRGKKEIKRYKETDFLSGEWNLFFKQASGIT